MSAIAASSATTSACNSVGRSSPSAGHGRAQARDAGGEALQHLGLEAGAEAERGHRQPDGAEHGVEVGHLAEDGEARLRRQRPWQVGAHQPADDGRVGRPHARHDRVAQGVGGGEVGGVGVVADKGDAVPLREGNVAGRAGDRPRDHVHAPGRNGLPEQGGLDG